MAFGLMQRKMAKPEIEQRVIDAAKILGIENLIDCTLPFQTRHPIGCR
jgi:ABC-type sugar transport system ATPase subunit